MVNIFPQKSRVFLSCNQISAVLIIQPAVPVVGRKTAGLDTKEPLLWESTGSRGGGGEDRAPGANVCRVSLAPKGKRLKAYLDIG